MGTRSSTASKATTMSDKWIAGIEDDDEEAARGWGRGRARSEGVRERDDPGSNDHVNVTGPEEDNGKEIQQHSAGTAPRAVEGIDLDIQQKTLKQAMRQFSEREDEKVLPLLYEANGTRKEKVAESPMEAHDEMESTLQPGEESDDHDLRIPGSFDLVGLPGAHGPGETWSDMSPRLSTCF